MEQTSNEVLCDALLREYLARKGYKEVLVVFDKVKPRDGSSITNRRELAVALHIEKLVVHNKEKTLPDFFGDDCGLFELTGNTQAPTTL